MIGSHRAVISFLAVVAAAASASPSEGQATRTVVGHVRSSTDSMPLSQVRVRVVGTAIGAESASDGRFVLRDVPEGARTLAFERIGVVSDSIVLDAERVSIVVFLRTTAIRMQPVVTEAASIARNRFENVVQTSTVSLDPIEIQRVPSVGEPDVTHVVQLFPGAVAKSDFTRGFNVRGGEVDENLLRLDGITVFNPYHLGGIFSTFNPDAVDRVDLHKGGFPAAFGGRLSSILDIELRPGNREAVNVSGGLSVLSARLLVEGPFADKGASYLVAARRTYVDAFVDAFSDDPFSYYFGDALAKVTVPLGSGAAISATGYWGRDAVSVPWVDAEPGRAGIDLGVHWGNRLAGITARQSVGMASLTHHVSVSEFASAVELTPDVSEATSLVRLVSANTNVVVSSGAHTLRIGGGVDGYDVAYDFTNHALGTQLLALTYRPTVWSAYLDEQWRPFRWLLVRPGVRFEHVAGGSAFTGLSPRFGFKVFPANDLAISGSVGRYYQAIHSIRDQDVPASIFDFWIGADSVTPVARSDHAVLGFERWVGSNLSISVEGYYKSFDHLVRQNFRDDPRVHGDEFVLADGDSRGIDLLLRRYVGDVTGWIGYGYAKTVRHTAADPSFPPAHDRRHTLNVVVQMPGPLKSRMGVHWGYGSPLPHTGIVGQWLHREYNAAEHTFDAIDDESISTTLNGERYPHYSRLDVSFRWQFEKWGGTWQPYVQLVNVYDRRNVWYYLFDYDRAPPTRRGRSQLPALPSFGVEFTW